jgi:anti-sigma factor RsiW
MPEHHITEILDNTALAELTDADKRAIHAHVGGCEACAQAFQAARISAVLMKERAVAAEQSVLQANPFFQTRVLAAWREQQDGAAAWSFRRLWKATGAIVASMAATTAALAVLTFVAPAADTNDQQTAALVPYSAETVVLDQDQDDNQLTNDQVISAIYADDDEGK